MGQSLYYIPKRDFVKIVVNENVYTIALGKHTIYAKCINNVNEPKDNIVYRGKRTTERTAVYLSLKNEINNDVLIQLYQDIRDEWQKHYYKLN